MSQHAALDAERWSAFDLDRQILMIANEMNRATRFTQGAYSNHLRLGYERVLRLVDLTVACQSKLTLLRELLRWRDLVAHLYVSNAPDRDAHRAALRALLQLQPVAARQIPFLP